MSRRDTSNNRCRCRCWRDGFLNRRCTRHSRCWRAGLHNKGRCWSKRRVTGNKSHAWSWRNTLTSVACPPVEARKLHQSSESSWHLPCLQGQVPSGLEETACHSGSRRRCTSDSAGSLLLKLPHIFREERRCRSHRPIGDLSRDTAQ